MVRNYRPKTTEAHELKSILIDAWSESAFDRISINQKIRVKLTVTGKLAYRKYHTDLGLNVDKFPLRTDREGYTEFMLFQLMQYFGRQMGLAGDSPFKSMIRVGKDHA